MVWLTDATTPRDMRLYAIGDVHGCIDELSAVHESIAEDLAAAPAQDWRIVHVGDFVDRGPDSAAVLQFLSERSAADPRIVNLRGNHDHMFAEALAGDTRMQTVWLQNGGDTTLADYGLSARGLSASSNGGTGDKIPQAHVDFLDNLPFSARFGDYFFVHAGIDPAIALDDQVPDDMMWIRERFLQDGREYDAVIVHGHTPTRRIDVRANRVGIDTGAVFGGHLSCLILDGMLKAQLTPEGRRPII